MKLVEGIEDSLQLIATLDVVVVMPGTRYSNQGLARPMFHERLAP